MNIHPTTVVEWQCCRCREHFADEAQNVPGDRICKWCSDSLPVPFEDGRFAFKTVEKRVIPSTTARGKK